MRRFLRPVLLPLLCLLLTGCGDRLLERSYSSLTPHSAMYWENQAADTLRAENYQDLVNALLLLLGEHSEEGVVRLYGERPDNAALAGRACLEVQQETALGSYLLDYITYDGKTEGGCYELTVRFRYRHTAEEQEDIVNATSTEALPDLLRSALEEGQDSLAVLVGYFSTDRAGVLSLIDSVHDEVYPPETETDTGPEAETAAESGDDAPKGDAAKSDTGESETGGSDAESETPDLSPWQVRFYPDTDQPGLVEVILHPKEGAAYPGQTLPATE